MARVWEGIAIIAKSSEEVSIPILQNDKKWN
jgi:hypothetical protein